MGLIYDQYRSDLAAFIARLQEQTATDPTPDLLGQLDGFKAALKLAEALGSDCLLSVQAEALEPAISQALGWNAMAKRDALRDPDSELLADESEQAQSYYDTLIESRDTLFRSLQMAPAASLEELADVMAMLNAAGHSSAADVFAALAGDSAQALPCQDTELRQIVAPVWGEQPPSATDLAAYLFNWQATRQRPEDIKQALAQLERPALPSIEAAPLGPRQRLSPLAAPEQTL
jgi:hypothetical protein